VTSPPIAQIVALLGRKWLMRVIWELRGDPLSFRQLQQACGDISPTVLNQRIKDLVATGLVERQADGYALTGFGRDLLEVYKPLSAWATRWVDATGGYP
jgi:DNA-binding HxlR family transcriptional regulator